MNQSGPAGRVTAGTGVALVEVVVGIATFAILALGVLALALAGTRTALDSERRVVALALVNEQIEVIRSLPYELVAYAPEGALLQRQTVTRNQQTYELETLVEVFNPEQEHVKKIQVTARWHAPAGGERDVQVVTYVTSAVFASAPQAPVYAHTHDRLYRMDAADPVNSLRSVGFFGVIQMRDVAVNQRGQMYGIRREFLTTEIYAINTETGQATPVTSWSSGANQTVGLTFLNDDVLAIGGTDLVVFYNISTNQFMGTVRITTGPGDVTQMAGDLVRLPSGDLWFVGSNDGSSEYCWRMNPTTGETAVVSSMPINRNSFPLVLGVACADAQCASVVGFATNGDMYTIDTQQCRIDRAETIGPAWTGAGEIP